MKKRLIINFTIVFWAIAAEVLVINASSKAQNQPLSFDVIEAVSKGVGIPDDCWSGLYLATHSKDSHL